MACTLLSRLLGIVKTRVLGSVFGAGEVADVINFTFNIPNNFRKLFAEGAVNSALIPAFSRLLGLEERERSRRLFALLCTYQTLLLVPLVLCSYFFRIPILTFLSDFDSSQIELGAKLLPFFMVYLASISLSATFNGILQVHHDFLHAYLSPLLFSLSVIIGVFSLSDTLGAMSMAYSVLAGGFLQGTYSYFMIRRYGYRFIPMLKVGDTPFKPVVKAWLLVTVGMGMQIVTQMISYLLASSLSEGSVTAFSNSTIFFQTPYGIFFNAISAVSLPLLSNAVALGQQQQVHHYTRSSMRSLLSLLLPSSILLFFLSQESVSVVLQTGNYTLADAQLTAWVLRPYLVFLVINGWYAMLLRLGYSANRHTQMTIISIVQNILDILLMLVFLYFGFDLLSLPLANGFSYLAGLVVLVFLLRDLWPAFHDRLFAKQVLQVLLANIPLFLYCKIYKQFNTSWYLDGSTWLNLLLLCMVGFGGLAILLVSYHFFHIPLPKLSRSK